MGKSSFVRAGVIPYLEEECLGYRFKSESSGELRGEPEPRVYVRATNDLLAQLGAVCDYCSRPYRYRTPLGDEDLYRPARAARHARGQRHEPGSREGCGAR